MSIYDKVEERSNDEGDVFRYLTTERNAHYSHWECIQKVKNAEAAFSRWLSRAVKTRTTWADPESNQQEMNELRWRLQSMQGYIESVERYLDKLEGVDRRAERIRALRRIEGRTPEEAAVYLEKAAQLESQA